MTYQPTTWTPERALEMFKDWDDPDMTIHEFCEKWYVSHNPDDFARIAIAALESAAAEIERQKARADGLAEKIVARLGRVDRKESMEDALERLLASHAEKLHEVERLRAELATVTKREADGVALFDQLLAEERAKVAKLRAELAAKQPAEAEAAQQGPSDQEIANVIESVGMCVNSLTAEALRMIARRAGVKL